MKRALLLLPLLAAGCQTSGDIVAESLAGPHPADADARVAAAPPPVPPSLLAIVPTGLGPTETSRVEPDPILPKMDSFWKHRRLPPGYEQYAEPTTRPADREVDLPPPPRYEEQERFDQDPPVRRGE